MFLSRSTLPEICWTLWTTFLASGLINGECWDGTFLFICVLLPASDATTSSCRVPVSSSPELTDRLVPNSSMRGRLVPPGTAEAAGSSPTASVESESRGRFSGGGKMGRGQRLSLGVRSTLWVDLRRFSSTVIDALACMTVCRNSSRPPRYSPIDVFDESGWLPEVVRMFAGWREAMLT